MEGTITGGTPDCRAAGRGSLRMVRQERWRNFGRYKLQRPAALRPTGGHPPRKTAAPASAFRAKRQKCQRTGRRRGSRSRRWPSVAPGGAIPGGTVWAAINMTWAICGTKASIKGTPPAWCVLSASAHPTPLSKSSQRGKSSRSFLPIPHARFHCHAILPCIAKRNLIEALLQQAQALSRYRNTLR
jgi:hypothetical protein